MTNPFERITGVKVFVNEPLAKHTSFHIGGNALYFIKIYSIKALKKVLHIIEKRRMKYFVIGAGTNLLVNDRGFSGVIIQLNGIFKKIKKKGNLFYCGGGAFIETFVTKAGELGYGGAEFLVGIPGTIGGGIIGNAGAFGKSFADITDTITIINNRMIQEDLSKNQIGFDYRSSKLRDGAIIMSAKIKLMRRKQKVIRAAIQRNIVHRFRQQPVGYSAGSFFKNTPHYSAGKLIEECGLKGLRIGDAEVSRKHGNWIINRGKARASDVMRLAKKVRKTVRDKKGVLLETEVRILN